MALSNWDTLAFGNDGKPTSGVFINDESKGWIEIYKNWIYVHDKKMWNKTSNYSKYIISQINEGNIVLSGFNITAKRGKQNGVYVYAETKKYYKNKDTITTRFAGIGCSGYIDKVEQVLTKLGRTKEISDVWWEGSGSKLDGKKNIVLDDKGNSIIVHHIGNFNTGEEIVYWDEGKQGPYDYSKDWTGVKKETVVEFFEWLEKLADIDSHIPDKDFLKWIALCKKSKAVRYNQGNAYFAIQAGLPLQATVVGKSKEPLMSQMIQKKNK